MSRIKGKDTKPEMLVRKFLHGNGFRYKLHDKKLPGKPDIVLPKYKTIIMVHGCFWHGHEGCRYFVIPKTKTEWWTNKIEKTRQQDLDNEQRLKDMGWRVISIFECSIKPKKREETLNNLLIKLDDPTINEK